MKETKKQDEKAKNGSHCVYPGKRMYTSNDVLRPNFGGGPVNSVTKTTEPTHEQIAMRAYSIWQEDGRPNDKQKECWLQAEAELKDEFE